MLISVALKIVFYVIVAIAGGLASLLIVLPTLGATNYGIWGFGCAAVAIMASMLDMATDYVPMPVIVVYSAIIGLFTFFFWPVVVAFAITYLFAKMAKRVVAG